MPGSRSCFRAALVGPDHSTHTVEIQFGDFMSSVGDAGHAAQGLTFAGRNAYSVSVPARTLTSVLDEAGVEHVDLLVLDIEGGELDALRGLDLGRHAPGHILIEMLKPELRAEYDELLAGAYAFAGELSPWDLLYRRVA
jgi:FkbM family methyltransferase